MSKGKFAAHVIQIMPHDVTVHDCCVGGCYNMFGFFERSYFTLAIIRRIYFYIVIKVRCAMADKRRNPKDEAMACDGAFNPRPDAVRDVLFLDNPFFDAGDLVQVRYEMVRRHQVDRMAISEVVSLFGVTRPTFYKARSALAEHGLVGGGGFADAGDELLRDDEHVHRGLGINVVDGDAEIVLMREQGRDFAVNDFLEKSFHGEE